MEQKPLANWQVVRTAALASIPAAIILGITLVNWNSGPGGHVRGPVLINYIHVILNFYVILDFPLGIAGAFAGKAFVNKVWGVWTGAILLSLLGSFAIAVSGIFCC